MASLQETKKAIKGYVGKNARTVYIHAGIWLNQKTKDIHMTVPKGKKFHTIVSKERLGGYLI